MSRPPTVEIKKTVQDPLPRIPFEQFAREILTDRYALSLVICGDKLARRMNKEYRKKGYSPNVLSFPLEKFEGEIFLNIRKAEREARAFGVTPRARLAHLFIHGCLHLAGLPHGNKMDAIEKRMLRKLR